MSEKQLKQIDVCSPFLKRINAPAKKDFDKYYLDITEKEVFKSTGEKDEEGNDLGVSEKKLIIKKIDISEYLESQATQVGIDHYIKNLALQGVDINEFNTLVNDDVVDLSNAPDNLADIALAGDKAKAAFASLDPALKGNHTSIEGFLNSLTQEHIDSYIQGRIDALTPKQNIVEGENK